MEAKNDIVSIFTFPKQKEFRKKGGNCFSIFINQLIDFIKTNKDKVDYKKLVDEVSFKQIIYEGHITFILSSVKYDLDNNTFHEEVFDQYFGFINIFDDNLKKTIKAEIIFNIDIDIDKYKDKIVKNNLIKSGLYKDVDKSLTINPLDIPRIPYRQKSIKKNREELNLKVNTFDMPLVPLMIPHPPPNIKIKKTLKKLDLPISPLEIHNYKS